MVPSSRSNIMVAVFNKFGPCGGIAVSQTHFVNIICYIKATSAPIHVFLEFFLSALCTIFFLSHRLLSHIMIIEATGRDERGMNPVAMTIINPRKEYWLSRKSNQRLPVLKSCILLTDTWGKEGRKKKVKLIVFSPNILENGCSIILQIFLYLEANQKFSRIIGK